MQALMFTEHKARAKPLYAVTSLAQRGSAETSLLDPSPCPMLPDANEWTRCLSQESWNALVGQFDRIVRRRDGDVECRDVLERISAEAKNAGCNAEELLVLVRSAWSQVKRPLALSNEAWSLAYHRVLKTCLFAYFSGSVEDTNH